MRASMAQLTSRFSSNRMVREYTESYYLPAARELECRIASNGKAGMAIEEWRRRITERWATLHFGNLSVSQSDPGFTFDVQFYLGEIEPADVEVRVWADPVDGEAHAVTMIERAESLVR